jgi:hypothetical protein
MENDGGMILTGETEELGDKSVPVPLCPLQIPHGEIRSRTRASAVRGWRLTALATARKFFKIQQLCIFPECIYVLHIFLEINCLFT